MDFCHRHLLRIECFRRKPSLPCNNAVRFQLVAYCIPILSPAYRPQHHHFTLWQVHGTCLGRPRIFKICGRRVRIVQLNSLCSGHPCILRHQRWILSVSPLNPAFFFYYIYIYFFENLRWSASFKYWPFRYQIQFSGMAAMTSAYLVAFKQFVPEHLVSFFQGILAIRVKVRRPPLYSPKPTTIFIDLLIWVSLTIPLSLSPLILLLCRYFRVDKYISNFPFCSSLYTRHCPSFFHRHWLLAYLLISDGSSPGHTFVSSRFRMVSVVTDPRPSQWRVSSPSSCSKHKGRVYMFFMFLYMERFHFGPSLSNPRHYK